MNRILAVPSVLALLCSAPMAAADVSFNGFASVGIGVADEDANTRGYNKDFSATPDSLAAAQFGYQINDNMSATLQIIARGADDWDPEMEWAYLTYAFDNGALIRGGKLRLPLYMYSDYLDVRYAQPFLRPPAEVYNIVPFSSYTGVDAVIPFAIGDGTLSLQALLGTTKDESTAGGAVVEFEMKNLIGANLTWEWNDLYARVVYAGGDLEADPAAGGGVGSLLNDKKGTFAGVGLRYDPGQFFVLGEYGTRKVDDQFADAEGAYIGAGYRFDKLTPYLLVGYSQTTDDSDRAGMPPLQQAFDYERKNVSVGLRYDFMDNVAAKFDVSYYYDFNDTNGGIISNQAAVAGVKNSTVIALSVDTVF